MSKKKSSNSGTKERDEINVSLGLNESESEAAARMILDPVAQAGLTTFHTFRNQGELTLQALMDRLGQDVSRSVGDNSLANAQVMLASQAYTLDAIFNDLARRSALNASEYLGACETYMKIALRAQSQCRATWEAISNIKHPRTATFVKQANIAENQQVINGEPSRVEKNVNPPNELLEHEDAERLDFGTAATPGRTDKDMETVGAVNWSENSKRKAKIQS